MAPENDLRMTNQNADFSSQSSLYFNYLTTNEVNRSHTVIPTEVITCSTVPYPQKVRLKNAQDAIMNVTYQSQTKTSSASN